MGRTKRKRLKNRCSIKSISLDNESHSINLKKFMSLHNWCNETQLQLRYFPETGRGVNSLKSIGKNDILIKVPYNVLITLTTLETSNFLSLVQEELKIHELLTAFLLWEKSKTNSDWLDYINSLPQSPIDLPWLSRDKIVELPDDLGRISVNKYENLRASWLKCQKSIRDCVYLKDFNLFSWAYTMVNTRAVYVNSKIIWQITDCKYSCYLEDDPCMALCPFLDMFNHSCNARTEADFVLDKGEYFYTLTSLNSYRKYEQIFISYGSFSNDKLVIEYGFFLGNNDTFLFSFKEILAILKLKLSGFQYKYIYNRDFSSLFVDCFGQVSFNLKALLFVAFSNVKNFSDFIYSDNYSEEFLTFVEKSKRELVRFKLSILEKDLNKLSSPLLISYFKHKINIIRQLL